MSLPVSAAAPLAILSQISSFCSYLNLNRNLLFGYLSQCPVGGKRALLDLYIASRKEEEWNSKHEAVLKEKTREYDVSHPVDNSSTFWMDRTWYILSEETKLVKQELAETYGGKECGYVKLRRADGSYHTRWLQVFFNQVNTPKELRKKVAAELLSADDYILIKKDAFPTSKAGGRTDIGRLANRAIVVLKEAVKEIDGKPIPKEKRPIVILKQFSDLLGSINVMVSSGPLKQLSEVLGMAQLPGHEKIRMLIPSQYRESVVTQANEFKALVEGAKIPDDLRNRQFREDQLVRIQSAVEQFFIQAKLAYDALSSFRRLLQENLESDFDPSVLAQAVSKLSIDTPLRRSTDRRITVVQPRPKSLNLSQSGGLIAIPPPPRSPTPSESLSARQSSTMASPRASPRAGRTPTQSPRSNSPRDQAMASSPRSILRKSGNPLQQETSPKHSPRADSLNSDLYLKRQEYLAILEPLQGLFKAILEKGGSI
jgi:hypothetical protein